MTIALRPPFDDEALALTAYGDTVRVGLSAEAA